MKASTLFLGFTLVVLAAALAGLWQAFGPHSASHLKPTASAPVQPVAKRPAPPPVTQPEASPPNEGVRTVDPNTGLSAGRSPLPETSPPALITPPPPAPTPSATPAPVAPPPPDPSAALSPHDAPRAVEPVPADAGGESVDLNTASADALNGLGAGKIAKTIIANRPYTAPDDLVTRRVLKRKDYDAIKSRIVVR